MKLSDRRFSVLLIIFTFLSLSGAGSGFPLSAQPREQSQANCPTLQVTSPDQVTKGEKLIFTVQVKGGDKNVTPTFNWSVSSGSIESGQGTSTIEVGTGELEDDSTVTATVELGGYDRDCSTVTSCTSYIEKKVEPRKLLEYGKVGTEAEQANLDYFTVELQSDPTAQGYIIAYGGRTSSAGETEKWAIKAKSYLTQLRGVDAGRIVVLDGGYREQPAIELWIVPSGATPPTATPTVDPGEIKASKPAQPKKPAKGKKN